MGERAEDRDKLISGLGGVGGGERKRTETSSSWSLLCIVFSLLDVILSQNLHLSDVSICLPRDEVDFLQEFPLVVFELANHFTYTYRCHVVVPQVIGYTEIRGLSRSSRILVFTAGYPTDHNLFPDSTAVVLCMCVHGFLL